MTADIQEAIRRARLANRDLADSIVEALELGVFTPSEWDRITRAYESARVLGRRAA